LTVKSEGLLAAQKVRPALPRLLRTLTYNVYAFTPEQPLRLGERNFYLASLFVFARPSRFEDSSKMNRHVAIFSAAICYASPSMLN
jgi:hypothetical protein